MNKTTTQKDFLVLVATGFEDIELITVIDILARNKVTFDLVSPENKTQVNGSFSAIVKTVPLTDVSPSTYRGLFIPGGAAVDYLADSSAVKALTKEFAARKSNLAAICAGPRVLHEAGALDNVKYTSYPGLAASERNTGETVVLDGKVLTGRDWRSAVEFGDELAKLAKRHAA